MVEGASWRTSVGHVGVVVLEVSIAGLMLADSGPRVLVIVQKVDLSHFRNDWHDIRGPSNYHCVLLE